LKDFIFLEKEKKRKNKKKLRKKAQQIFRT